MAPDKTESGESLTQILTTGIAGLILVLLIAALCIFPFEHHFFTDWVATAFMAATPAQVILGLLWHNAKPEWVNRYSAVGKGVALTAITVCAGVMVMGLILLLVSGGHGITPMLVQFTIMTVVAVLWLVAVWGCWPFTVISSDSTVYGLLTLLGAYLLAYGLWIVFFDYSVLAKIGHPHYYADIHPRGLFDMWQAMTFFVTTAAVIVIHLLFDFWPVDKLSKGAGQPLRGLIATVYIVVLSWGIRALFVGGLSMGLVEYMIRVPVCLIFGAFIVNNMMQFSLFSSLAQPRRGLLLTGLAALVGVLMYSLYSWASQLHTGQVLGMGPEHGFAREIWIASAMLGITFPIIFVVSGFFAFWPIKRP